jgi:hypothetical protein
MSWKDLWQKLLGLFRKQEEPSRSFDPGGGVRQSRGNAIGGSRGRQRYR